MPPLEGDVHLFVVGYLSLFGEQLKNRKCKKLLAAFWFLTLSPFTPRKPGGPGRPGRPGSPLGPYKQRNIKKRAQSIHSYDLGLC